MIILFLILWPIIGFLSSLLMIHFMNRSIGINSGFENDDFYLMVAGAIGGYIMLGFLFAQFLIFIWPKEFSKTWGDWVNSLINLLNRIIYKKSS